MAKKTFRMRFTFWLDITKDEENEIAGMIEELKEKRSFAKVVRDGIRLVYSLKHGRTEVLLEMFPWIKELVVPVQNFEVTDPFVRQQLEYIAKQLQSGGFSLNNGSRIENLSEGISEHTLTIQEVTVKPEETLKKFLNSFADF